jgi:dGTPase
MDVRYTRSRRYPEPQHPYRNDFARDRDRIIHARAFRRLEAKTQVFTTRYSDHFRNRLTHTLEVAQIARTVADALRLDSDLAEALALVHDIGHPPFGHAGERQLDARLRAFGDRFDHNLHALHIVERFESRYISFPGLNLTFEVREGIIKHSGPVSEAEFPALAEYDLSRQPPIESQLIDLTDEIAYNAADLDDAYEARLLDMGKLHREVPLFDELYAHVERAHPAAADKLKFNETLRRIIDRLATDLIDHTRSQAEAAKVRSSEDVRNLPARLAGFSAAAGLQNAELKHFLHSSVYSHPAIAEERERTVQALDALFTFFLEHPERMPKIHAVHAQTEPRHRVVCDYIAGMTDHFLLRQVAELLGKTAGRPV